MNIFYLDQNPTVCAQMHVDKHVVKMILESAQLLSTVHHYYQSDIADQLYKSTHLNHPSTVWVRSGHQNYLWLYSLLVALCKEYTHRYGKIHKTEWSGMMDLLQNIPSAMPRAMFTEPTPAMPDECKVPNDSIASYRKYYIEKKSHMAKWTKQFTPNWFTNAVCAV